MRSCSWRAKRWHVAQKSPRMPTEGLLRAPAKERIALALIWFTPLLWTVYWVVALQAPGVVTPMCWHWAV